MGLYSKDPFEELEAKLQVVEGKIDYIVRLLKQNGFKDYEMEAAYKANLAMAKEINAKWEQELSKLHDNSKANEYGKQGIYCSGIIQ